LLLLTVPRVKVNRFVAARILGVVLAGALLVFELLASSSGFHQALHHSGKAASSSCVLCVFAKGQLDLPQSVPVVTASIQSSLALAPRMDSIAFRDFPYLTCPSRAPPALPSLLSVEA
jgi:hypothetical protein